MRFRALAAGLTVALSLAQTGTTDYRIRISVDLVQLDAVVTDPKGGPVTDLKASDFEVVLDGKPQPVRFATYVDMPAGPPPELTREVKVPGGEKSAAALPPMPLPPLKPEEVKRTIVFFVDDLSLAANNVTGVRAGLRKAILNLQANDLAAVIRSSAGLGALQDFTNDRRMLLAAADQVRWRPLGRGEIDSYYQIGKDPIAEQMEMGDNNGSFGYESLEALRTQVFTGGTLQALDDVVRGMASLPGRRVIVMLSDYLPLSTRSITQGPLMGPSAASSRDYTGVMMSRAGRVVEHAVRAGVVISAVDTRGLTSLSMTASDRPRFEDGMPAGGADPTVHVQAVLGNATNRRYQEYLGGAQGGLVFAADTGGVLISETNDIGYSLGKVYSGITGYYLLGFDPPEGTFKRNKDGKAEFRKFTLKVNRPGVTVRTRSGFVGVPDSQFEQPSESARLELSSSLTSPFRETAVRADVRCAFISVEKTRSLILTRVGIDAHDLSFEGPAQNRSAVVHLIVRAFGVSGAELDGGMDQRIRVSLDENGYRTAMAHGLVYSTNVSVSTPGPYQVRAAILDEGSGKRGTASEFLIVPKLEGGRLALSGITFPAYFSREDDVTPAWQRLAVKPGQAVPFAFQAFNASGRTLAMRTRLYRDGKPVYEGQSEELSGAEKGKHGQVVGKGNVVVPAGADAGEYLLQLEVESPIAKGKTARAWQWARLSVITER